jgi:hypothetical protein
MGHKDNKTFKDRPPQSDPEMDARGTRFLAGSTMITAGIAGAVTSFGASLLVSAKGVDQCLAAGKPSGETFVYEGARAAGVPEAGARVVDFVTDMPDVAAGAVTGAARASVAIKEGAYVFSEGRVIVNGAAAALEGGANAAAKHPEDLVAPAGKAAVAAEGAMAGEAGAAAPRGAVTVEQDALDFAARSSNELKKLNKLSETANNLAEKGYDVRVLGENPAQLGDLAISGPGLSGEVSAQSKLLGSGSRNAVQSNLAKGSAQAGPGGLTVIDGRSAGLTLEEFNADYNSFLRTSTGRSGTVISGRRIRGRPGISLTGRWRITR